MKAMKKLSLLLMLTAALLLMSGNAFAAVKISMKSAVLVKGQVMTLKVTGTKAKVKWTSGKKSIAAVSSAGKVTAKKAGTTTITAKAGSKKLTCKVTVKNTLDVAKYRNQSVTKLVKAIGGLKKDGNYSMQPYGQTAAKQKAYFTNNVLINDGYSDINFFYLENTHNPNLYVYGTKILGQRESTVTSKLKKKGFTTTGSFPCENSVYGYSRLQLFLRDNEREQISVAYASGGKAVYYRYYPWGSRGTNG